MASTHIVARAEGIPEGSDGQTSWQIQKKLSAQKHFWRVYADLGTIRLTSMIANFIVPEEPEPILGGDGNAILTDALTNGGSIGQVSGGTFTSQGWQVQKKNNFIRYVIRPVVSGYVQFRHLGHATFQPQPRSIHAVRNVGPHPRGLSGEPVSRAPSKAGPEAQRTLPPPKMDCAR